MALAWLPLGERLIGVDSVRGEIVEVWSPRPPHLAYDDVRALVLREDGATSLEAVDAETGAYLGVDRAAQTATEQYRLPAGTVVEGMAWDHARRTVYAADLGSGRLLALSPEHEVRPVGEPGSFGEARIRALALDRNRDVLYGIDGAARRLVRVDRETSEVLPVAPDGAGLGYDSIEALAWDPGIGALLAVDRASRTLVLVDPETGTASFLAPIAFGAVRDMVAVPGAQEMLLVDTDLDRIVAVDLFTGQTMDPFVDPTLHRGGADDSLSRLWWPRGDVRAAGLATFAVEVGSGHDERSRLVFRRGGEVLHEEPFAPERTVTIAVLPEAVRRALRAGDEVTWGIETPGKEAIRATFHVVVLPAVETELAELARNPLLARQGALVREVRAARVLMAHRLYSEALARLVESGSRAPESIPLVRGLVSAVRGLLGSDDLASDVLDLLGSTAPPRPLPPPRPPRPPPPPPGRGTPGGRRPVPRRARAGGLPSSGRPRRGPDPPAPPRPREIAVTRPGDPPGRPVRCLAAGEGGLHAWDPRASRPGPGRRPGPGGSRLRGGKRLPPASPAPSAPSAPGRLARGSGRAVRSAGPGSRECQRRGRAAGRGALPVLGPRLRRPRMAVQGRSPAVGPRGQRDLRDAAG